MKRISKEKTIEVIIEDQDHCSKKCAWSFKQSGMINGKCIYYQEELILNHSLKIRRLDICKKEFGE